MINCAVAFSLHPIVILCVNIIHCDYYDYLRFLIFTLFFQLCIHRLSSIVRIGYNSLKHTSDGVLFEQIITQVLSHKHIYGHISSVNQGVAEPRQQRCT